MVAMVWLHLFACAGLWLYGAHRIWMLFEYRTTLRRAQKRKSSAASSPPFTMRCDDEEAADPVPYVTVQLPLFNERSVAARLIDAVCRLRYPQTRLHIQVLDDSQDDTADICARTVARWQAEGIDVEHLRREDRQGFKAGALQWGLSQAKGELIAIFDADFVPRPDFLEQTVPSFADSEIGMVQARWGHLNRNQGWLTQAQAVFLDAHFSIEHRVRADRGRFFNFNGTAGVWRKSAIEDAGGWDAATLTEDLDLSFRAQLAGARFDYLDHVEVPAELPSDVTAFKGQQHRWAKGSLQTARRLLGKIWKAPLPLAVKCDAALKLTQNLAFLLLAVVVITMPMVALGRAVDGTLAQRIFDLMTLFIATLPVAIHFWVAERARGEARWRAFLTVPLAIGLGAALAINNARAVLEGLFGQGHDEFVRTPKRGGDGLSVYRTPIHLLVFVELTLGVLHLGAALQLIARGHWWMTPFLLLFGASLSALALQSLWESRWRPRRQSVPATA